MKLSFENNQRSQWELSSATWAPLMTVLYAVTWVGGLVQKKLSRVVNKNSGLSQNLNEKRGVFQKRAKRLSSGKVNYQFFV